MFLFFDQFQWEGVRCGVIYQIQLYDTIDFFDIHFETFDFVKLFGIFCIWLIIVLGIFLYILFFGIFDIYIYF